MCSNPRCGCSGITETPWKILLLQVLSVQYSRKFQGYPNYYTKDYISLQSFFVVVSSVDMLTLGQNEREGEGLILQGIDDGTHLQCQRCRNLSWAWVLMSHPNAMTSGLQNQPLSMDLLIPTYFNRLEQLQWEVEMKTEALTLSLSVSLFVSFSLPNPFFLMCTHTPESNKMVVRALAF